MKPIQTYDEGKGELCTIMVVNDDEAMRALLADALQGNGCRVVESSGGKGALDAIQTATPNLIRFHRVWQEHWLQLPCRKRRRKICTEPTLQPMAKTKHNVRSWDFVHDPYGQGEPLRRRTVKDEATRFCLALAVGRSLTHQHVIEVLRQLIARYGRPR